MFIKNGFPVVFSYEKSIAFGEGLVDEVTSFVKGCAIGPDQITIFEPDNVLFMFVDLKANFINALAYENDLANIFLFLE